VERANGDEGFNSKYVKTKVMICREQAVWVETSLQVNIPVVSVKQELG